MAFDSKYGVVTFERGDIKEDEPVFVLRGQDYLVPEVLEAYLNLCDLYGCPPNHLQAIKNQIQHFMDYRAKHYTKLPGVRK